jgi:hypothetical protein
VAVLVDLERLMALQVAVLLRSQQYQSYVAPTTRLQLAALVQILFLVLLLLLAVAGEVEAQ